MPSTRGITRLDTWLSKLLWLLAQQNGGELRLDSTDIEDAPDKCTVFTDWDKEKHQLIIRASSCLSEMIVINTEQQWAKSTTTMESSQPSPGSSPQPVRESPRSAVIDDELAAKVEARILQKAAERTRQRQSRERQEAEARMFQE